MLLTVMKQIRRHADIRLAAHSNSELDRQALERIYDLADKAVTKAEKGRTH